MNSEHSLSRIENFFVSLHITNAVLDRNTTNLVSELHPSVTDSGMRFLIYLDDHGGSVQQSDFERDLRQSRSSISRLLDHLEADGLVQRLKNQHDERKLLIILTPEGRRLSQRMHRLAKDMYKQLLSGLPADQIASTLQTISQIRERAEHLTHLQQSHSQKKRTE
jgi:DNA-binding MarR family transcriptional regulator